MSTRVSRLLMTSALCMAVGFGVIGCSKPKTNGAATDSSAAGTTATATGSEQEKNKELSRQFVDEVFGKGNMAFIDEHTAPDFVEHTPSPRQEPGIAGFKKFVTDFRTAMPDLKFEVVHLMAEGDMVVIHIRETGTQTGPMMGLPASGKKMDVEGIDLIRIKDGKMVEHWGYLEQAKMMTQLGMMPPMDGAPKSAGGGDHGAMHDTSAMGGDHMTDTTKK